MAKSNETWVTINGNHVCIDSKSGKITKGPDALKGMTVMQASKASKSSKSTSSKKSTTAKTGAKKAQPVKKEDTSKKKDTPKKKEKMVYVNGEWAVVDENGTIVRAYQHGLEGLNYNDRKGIAKATKEANAPIIEDLKKDAIKLAKSTKGMTEDERERVLMREAEGLAHEDYFDASTKAFDTEVKKQNKANTSFTKSESKKK